MKFSSRVNAGRMNPIAAAAAEAKAAGNPLGQLNDSNPTHHGLAPSSLPGVYTADPRGPLPARQEIADFINRTRDRAENPLDPSDLYVLSSTSEAYAWLSMLLCNPGEAILMPKPGYPLIESICSLTAVRAIPYMQFYDGSWGIDMASMERTLEAENGAVRAIAIINPNNPTGAYTKPEERRRIVELARRYDAAIIADEVFYDFELEPFDSNARWAGERDVLTFSLDGFSKMLAAPHAKVGWIEVSGPKDDVAQAERHLDMISDDFLPMSDIIVDAIPSLLGEAQQQTELVKRRVQGNLARLRAILADDKMQGDGVVDVERSEGGWNVLVRFPSVIDENDLGLRLARTYHMNCQPGYYFDMQSNGYLSISLLPRPEEFERNVRTILAAVHDELGA
ncbi:MAG: pyridoxal phosphate-dependent aminotransferase [Bifidobacteriaceae bacterium]|nr:pyridoxal phosphate-dependent aminotransferase [Bifidobacteriaceae bacterium]